ncbi:MAG: hypothetical protein KDD50_09670 [Bdellovibrionales bacterium]|nr:hypothetical protein [Bdellovibrionales bacterium]
MIYIKNSKINIKEERKKLEGLLEKPLPKNLQEIGMEHFTQEDFQSIFDFVEILINVKERIRNDGREEILHVEERNLNHPSSEND